MEPTARAEPVAEFDEIEPLVMTAEGRVAPNIEGPVFIDQRLDGPFCHARQDSADRTQIEAHPANQSGHVDFCGKI